MYCGSQKVQVQELGLTGAKSIGISLMAEWLATNAGGMVQHVLLSAAVQLHEVGSFSTWTLDRCTWTKKVYLTVN